MMFNMDRLKLDSRRSTIMAPTGAVATSQPLAVQAGIAILKSGGNAVDAAVATAAVLNVVEPGSIGIGGDLFAMIYTSETDSLTGLNASGWSPRNATIELYKEKGYKTMPNHGIFSITIPGALAGWAALLERFGTLSFKEVLGPAITYARDGFPVSERIAHQWKGVVTKLSSHPGGHEYLINGRAPVPGQLFKQRHLASTFEAIGNEGAEVFYQGVISKKIITFLRDNGSIIEEPDLSDYQPEWVKPLSIDYKEYTLYELPPNCQGLCALEALQIASHFDLSRLEFNSAEYLHRLIESMKLAFADGHHFITDPRFRKISVDHLISETYCKRRSDQITEKAIKTPSPMSGASDTAYLTVVDKNRNMVSFINSLYNHFGSGVVVAGTGIALQNRGSSFNLDETHNNCLESRKRPFHTIIPALIYKNGKPFMSFGVMGGHMQPQGHLQVTSNIINFQMSPQDALDAPRFRFEEGDKVHIESNVPSQVITKLIDKGHRVELVEPFSPLFGGGQIIIVDHENACLFAGSDPRKDGCAIGY